MFAVEVELHLAIFQERSRRLRALTEEGPEQTARLGAHADKTRGDPRTRFNFGRPEVRGEQPRNGQRAAPGRKDLRKLPRV